MGSESSYQIAFSLFWQFPDAVGHLTSIGGISLLASSYHIVVFFAQNSIGGVSHLSGDHVNEPFLLVHFICAHCFLCQPIFLNIYLYVLFSSTEAKMELLVYFYITSKSSNLNSYILRLVCIFLLAVSMF